MWPSFNGNSCDTYLRLAEEAVMGEKEGHRLFVCKFGWQVETKMCVTFLWAVARRLGCVHWIISYASFRSVSPRQCPGGQTTDTSRPINSILTSVFVRAFLLKYSNFVVFVLFRRSVLLPVSCVYWEVLRQKCNLNRRDQPQLNVTDPKSNFPVTFVTSIFLTSPIFI